MSSLPLSEKSPAFEQLSTNSKIKMFGIVGMLGFGIIAAQLFRIQIVHNNHYTSLATRQYSASIPIRANRGTLFDRNGEIITQTTLAFSFAADPTTLQRRSLVCLALSQATGRTQSEFDSLILSAKLKKAQFVWLARGVNTTTFPLLDTLKDPGLIRFSEPRRAYHHGATASQIIGLVNIDNAGVSGLELYYDSLLRGSNGILPLMRNGKGELRPTLDQPTISPRNGYGLQTTIDIELQSTIEYELQQGLDDAKATSATALAIDPKTGEILSVVSLPSYDPQKVKTLAPEHTRLRAFTDTYEPGSTFKLVTASAVLEEKLVAPSDRFDGMGGTMHIKDHDIIDDHPVGECSFREGLEKSSNIVFAQISERIPDHKFYKYARDFGFGIPSGVDVVGEVRGSLKKPKSWDETSKYFMSYGYQLAATGLQIATAYATIANGGVMMKPHIVRAVLAGDGSVVQEIKPQIIRRVVSKETADTLTKMLVGVVDGGTGQSAKLAGMRIAGKTGTAQQVIDGVYSKSAYTASFVGFFPAEDPQVVLLIMLDKPLTDIYGGKTAAPIFRRIVARVSQKYGTNSKTSHGEPTESQQTMTRTVETPNLVGLTVTSAQKVCADVGLQLDASSADTNSIIRTQSPSASSELPVGSSMRVSVQSSESRAGARPNVIGLSLREAVFLIKSYGAEIQIHGSGKVRKQEWIIKGNQKTCRVECQ